MKKIITSALSAALVCLCAVSCYTDKGNYDYSYNTDDIVFLERGHGAIEILESMEVNRENMLQAPFMFRVGENVEIPARYTILDKSLTESDLAFEWLLGDQVVSTESVLRIDPKPVGDYSGILHILDTKNNQIYSRTYNFRVDPKYTDGWAILSENGAENQISYLHLNLGDNGYEAEYEENVFAKANNGEKLSNVTDICAHMYDTYPQVFSLSVAQSNETGPIDIDIHSMGKLANYRDQFIGQVPDENFIKVQSLSTAVLLLSDKGNIYARTEEKEGFSDTKPHEGLFPTTPFGNEYNLNITHWINMSNMASGFSGINETVAYDENKHRCVVVHAVGSTNTNLGMKCYPFNEQFYMNSVEPNRNGPGFDGTNYYNDITFPDPYDLSGYKVLAMKGCGRTMDLFADASFLSVVMLLQKESTGKLYIYSFSFFVASTGRYDVDLDLFYPLPDNLQIDPETMLCRDFLGSSNHHIFLSNKDRTEIYYVKALSPGGIGKIYSSDSPITCFCPGEIGNFLPGWGMYDTIYYQLFLVAKENGDIDIVRIDDFAYYGGGVETVCTVKGGAGKITQACFLSNSSANF
ncbi:MAG: hypothetical protein HUJ91_00280 [Bacteroidales bacterium]|nr:hypothetical protein [Bacteroidales bacterium]